MPFAFSLAQADDLKTRDGTIYRNYKILGHDADSVTIIYEGGGGKVLLSQLPDELQKRFGYVSAAPATNAVAASPPAAATSVTATSTPIQMTPAPVAQVVPTVAPNGLPVAVPVVSLVAPESPMATLLGHIDEKSRYLSSEEGAAISPADREEALKLLHAQIEKIKPRIISDRTALERASGGTVATLGGGKDRNAKPATSAERILSTLEENIRVLEMTRPLPPAVQLSGDDLQKVKDALVDVRLHFDSLNGNIQQEGWYMAQNFDLPEEMAVDQGKERLLRHQLGLLEGDGASTLPAIDDLELPDPVTHADAGKIKTRLERLERERDDLMRQQMTRGGDAVTMEKSMLETQIKQAQCNHLRRLLDRIDPTPFGH